MLKILAILILLAAVLYIGYKLHQISQFLESMSKMFENKHDKDTPHLG